MSENDRTPCSPEEYRKRIKNEEKEIKKNVLGWTGGIAGVAIGLIFWAATDIANYSSEKKAQQTQAIASQGAHNTQSDINNPNP